MKPMNDRLELSGGQVTLCIEQETLHLRAADPYGDPVELTNKDAIALAKALLAFAAKVE